VRRYDMDEFDGLEGSGAKAMRETIDRKNEEIAKLSAELSGHKEKELDDVFKQLGLDSSKGFGKALKQVYDGDVTVEAVEEFARTEYGYESSGVPQEVTQSEEEPVVRDDARARVAQLDANSQSDVPRDVLDDLQNIIAKGSPKDAIRAKLTLMEDEKASQK